VVLLLARKDLPEIDRRAVAAQATLESYAVKKSLVLHRHARLVSLRLLRDLYLMDLVQLTLRGDAGRISAVQKRN